MVALQGQTISDLKRKGKYLLFMLEGAVLVSHLRMEGKYILKKDEPPAKHEHVIFHFTDGLSQVPRCPQFGTMDLFQTDDLESIYLMPL